MSDLPRNYYLERDVNVPNGSVTKENTSTGIAVVVSLLALGVKVLDRGTSRSKTESWMFLNVIIQGVIERFNPMKPKIFSHGSILPFPVFEDGLHCPYDR
jgi:hypothetical protein